MMNSSDSNNKEGKEIEKVPLPNVALESKQFSNHIKPGFVGILVVNTLSMTMEVNLNFISKPYVKYLAISVSQPVSRTLKRMQLSSIYIKLSWICYALLN